MMRMMTMVQDLLFIELKQNSGLAGGIFSPLTLKVIY